MSDSSRSDRLAAKQQANQEARLDGIKRWVEYIRTHPPAVWGEQQNELVNTQLESARATDSSPEHEQRIRAFGATMTQNETEDAPEE